ncbi:MAG: hypothetical protein NZ898_05150 [Myxococcota bacterium]|nr:hypothetical protein [Myxococcota bacterium]MDW8363464.1 hypothetical protein [Myxococcales bacterium]
MMRRERTAVQAALHASLIVGACAGLASGCGGDEPGGSPCASIPTEPTYANVEALVECACAFSSCHGGTGRGAARLQFGPLLAAGEPITAELVGVTACQYDRMPLVTPGDPSRSWLMIKLEGPYEPATGQILPGAWGPAPDFAPPPYTRESTCPLVIRGPGGELSLSFGRIMPWSTSQPHPLDRAHIEMFRRWIEAGAPGPDGAPSPLPDAGASGEGGIDPPEDAGVGEGSGA